MPASALEIIKQHAGREGGLLPALHELQHAFGHIPTELVGPVAQAFNISRAEVHGVISFYPDFRTEPAGTHVLRICRAEACQSMGAEELAAHAMKILGCGFHSTTPDARFTLEPVYCLGLCAQSPAITLDDQPYARVTPQQLEALLGSAGLQPGGQVAKTEGQP